MKVLIIDNYDSFTFNLYQYIGELLEKRSKNFTLDVERNDKITIAQIRKRGYDRIILSPGPGDPKDRKYFGVCSEVLLAPIQSGLQKKTKVLGVCLGMQGMAYYFGGKVVKAHKPMHGKTSIVKHDGKGIFKGLPQDLEVMRYHSLVAEKDSLSQDLSITAEADGEIMGLRHKKYPIEGIQFHPESFATEAGKRMLENFIYGK